MNADNRPSNADLAQDPAARLALIKSLINQRPWTSDLRDTLLAAADGVTVQDFHEIHKGA